MHRASSSARAMIWRPYFIDAFGPTINAFHSLGEHFFFREEELYRDFMFNLKLHVGLSKVKVT